MTLNVVYSDPAKAVRDYMRDHAADLGVTSTNVNVGVKDTDDAQIVVFRAGGGDDTSDAELDRATLQIDIWHPTSYNTAVNVKNKVRALLRELRSTQLNATTHGYGAEVASEIFLPDRETNHVRFAITANVVVRAIS